MLIYISLNVKQAFSTSMYIMLESVPGTNQYSEMRLKCLAQENNGSLWWGLNAQLTDYESDALHTVPRHPSNTTKL